MEDNERDFHPSELGTKEFWDNSYEKELYNFKEIGDVGEIWFGEGSQKRVIDWLEKEESVAKDATILDLGCGNGIMLIELRMRGYTSLCGGDYSEGAIELAKQIGESEGIKDIKFEVVDILSDDVQTNPCLLASCYKVCLDKGTYDAISLRPEDSLDARQKYRLLVKKVLQEDGLFLITSCNWTKDELVEQFQNDFSLHAELPTPTFRFGNATGKTVTSLVFKKVSDCCIK